MVVPKRNILLKIPSILYGVGVALRNFAFDNGWLLSEPPPVPTICVGNIAVGGTGKTPHIEFLIRHFSSSHRIAVLSRGYGRKSDTPMEVLPEHTVDIAGDEPLQIKQKFPHVYVYVDGNRLRAMRHFEAMPKDKRPTLILMDDGFQHRYVKPTYTLLLTSFHRPFTQDDLLPYGNLREPQEGKYRADSVIVTRTPSTIKPIQKKLLEGEMELQAHQSLYFSYMRMMPPRRILSDDQIGASAESVPPPKRGSEMILVAGIANPNVFFLRQKGEGYVEKARFAFPDHHNFQKKEIDSIVEQMRKYPEAYLITTEKDAVRLYHHLMSVPPEIQARCFCVPIEVFMEQGVQTKLLAEIRSAVEQKNKRACRYEK
ncbi:MAG: tetraacyldisaccharide 4'-kinase [Porphyromonas sp.]|nr:tetraacyldisaccharide 4'-kinase [Porphyromonas sp.]